MKVSQIDDLTRCDHFYLKDDDECLYLREYVSGQGFGYGETNNLISNLKKEVSRRGKPEYRYKENAIRIAASDISGANLNIAWFKTAAIVPVPPSKTKRHPEYDDRIVQIANMVAAAHGFNVRELLVQTVDRIAAHATTEKRNPTMRAAELAIDEAHVDPPPPAILLLDDVITTGATFVACKRVLRGRFPDARVVGFFVARRTFVKEPDDDEDDEG
jgi:hypothetical protein